MSHIRYFVVPHDHGWSVRRDSKHLRLIIDEAEAELAAVEAAAIDRVRGHTVEVVKQGPDGRWTPCATPRS
jgi:hypothetical protein